MPYSGDPTRFCADLAQEAVLSSKLACPPTNNELKEASIKDPCLKNDHYTRQLEANEQNKFCTAACIEKDAVTPICIHLLNAYKALRVIEDNPIATKPQESAEPVNTGGSGSGIGPVDTQAAPVEELLSKKMGLKN